MNSRDFKGNQIYRIIIDPELQLKGDLNIFDGSSPTLIFNSIRDEPKNNVEFCKLDFKKDIVGQILKILYNNGVQSLIVAGGSITLNSFFESGIWDEAKVFVGNSVFLKGIKAPEFKGNLIAESEIVDDTLYTYEKTD